MVVTTKRKVNEEPKLVIRNATPDDIDGILDVAGKSYLGMAPYPKEMVLAQMTNFSKGCFVAILNGAVVGYTASIRISDKCLVPHSWREITGGGFGSTHEENGEYLYGYEVCVDPSKRRYKIGQRFYDQRKKLCRFLRLKGIVFAGRLPNLKKKIKEVGTVENYVESVRERKIKDPVLGFQLRNGFEVLGIFKNYLPNDAESLGYACHMIWRNPQHYDAVFNDSRGKKIASTAGSEFANSVRVATVQYKQRRVHSLEEFEKLVTYFVDVCGDYRCDFVLFPELFTLQLLSIDNETIPPHKAIEKITSYTEHLKKFFGELAMKYNVNIIAGSHPCKAENGDIHNVSFICLRDGRFYEQPKIHPTPNEKYWWNIKGADKLQAIPTDCGPIGVLICFDSEFPELSRYLADQGIKILFVPFLTDERQGYCRVRYCAQARAIENEIYVVMAGSVGNLPNVPNIDIHYSQSCILTPCDFAFARDGIASEATPNVEMLSFADLRIDTLIETRNTGTVQNLKGRRHELYAVKWYGNKLEH